MKEKQPKPVKVPVILQMEALECGAASLCMILAYYKKWVPLDKVRDDCGVSRDGSSADKIASAAAGYGLDVKAKRFGPGLIRTMGKFPCIIWWNYNHFVVLDGFVGEKAVLNDPAMGRVTVSKEEFESSYCNLCLQLTPNESFVADGKPKSVLEFFLKRTKGNSAALAIIIIVASLAAIAGIIIPSFSRTYTDYILGNGSSEYLSAFLGIFASLAVYQIICSIFNVIVICRLSGKMVVTSNLSFLWHMLRMPMAFFSQRLAGDLSSRQNANDKVAQTLVRVLIPTVTQLILLVFYLVIMINYSVPLTIVGVANAFVNLLISRYISQRRMELSRVQTRDEGKVVATTMSGIDMVETIKASGAENGFFERFAGYHASAMRSKVAVGRVNQYIGPVPALMQNIFSIILLTLGAWLIIYGHMTSGAFLAFQALMLSFLNPVNKLIMAGQSIQEMRSSMERIEDVMQYPIEDSNEMEQPETQDLSGVKKLSGNIELKNVTFGYSRLAPPLIEDFSMTLKTGSRVALVGGSGCGKSTIAKLITGLNHPWSGTITYDGKSRREIPRAVFTSSIAMVDQEVTMFADTIENNIKMWDTTIEDYDMVLAARDADIHDDIIKRNGGYHYCMQENGRDLSGGQRQRLEIARVLACDPSIIILDEATSALDAKTEFSVSEAIRSRGITCIIVAHRLSTIRDCDEIIVLDRGKVVERGNHETLLAKNGMYSKLITTL